MSFITKRDRVFREYELFDLPSRNEGKLKAYASCTDARAWSHFCSDKTEHLVDVIKRNNETCRPKYVPTDVIVNTLMRAKNKEIARLRRRIADVEELLVVYDQLDLNNEQKKEIEHAHASIKEAHKNFEDMFLDLNTSGYTEGIDSETFETGKSRDYDADLTSLNRPRGDETGDSILNEASVCSWPEACPNKLDCKCIQIGESVRYDAETSAVDPRIEELQETIVMKDARLNALHNITAVLENDVCEPYCVYAHIYTALEKIFAVLSHNSKYKKYLDAMMAGRDIRNFDIKGRIVFKMKVLEKFNLALIAPCNQDNINYGRDDCRCSTQIVARAETINTNIALISNAQKLSLDNKRSQLIADIMENTEMKEILSKENDLEDLENLDEKKRLRNIPSEDIYNSETYNINLINVKRIKDLQISYDELMNCYDNLKHEKLCLELQLSQHEELERELENMRTEVKEHGKIIKEREFYKQKSQELNELQEKYLTLSEESTSLEVQLKAESEINLIKNKTIDELKTANYELEQTLSEASLAFEKERNALQCRIKEMECKIMCQEEQIRSLTMQIDNLLQHKESNVQDISVDEIDSLNEQINNLKEVILCKEEEKHNLHAKYQEYIAKLRAEIEAWKNSNEQLASRNEFLEITANDLDKRLQEVITSKDDDKKAAVENLIQVITSKTEKLFELENALEGKERENKELLDKLRNLKESFSSHLLSLENEKQEAEMTLELAKTESEKLLEKVKAYDELIEKHEDMSRSFESNKNIMSREINNLRELNNDLLKEKQILQNDIDNYKRSLELCQNECKTFQNKIMKLDDLKKSYDKLYQDKINMEYEFNEQSQELHRLKLSIDLERKKSGELVSKLMESESSLEDANKLKKTYHKLIQENQKLQDKSEELDRILQKKNGELMLKNKEVENLMKELDKLTSAYNDLSSEKKYFENECEKQKDEIIYLREDLQKKNEENENLSQQVQELQQNEQITKNGLLSLENENSRLRSKLFTLKQESNELDAKVKDFERLQDEFNDLKRDYFNTQTQNIELNNNLQTVKEEIKNLLHEKEQILRYSEDIENALVQTRNEALKSAIPETLVFDLQKELDKLGQEKNEAHIKISNLLDELEESQHENSNLTEAIQVREGRIAVLERQISKLEEEIKQLYDDLNGVIDLGEQIKENSNEYMNQSLGTMKARHSRATHNMGIELAKIKNEKIKLEKQLSDHKIETEKTVLSDLRKLKKEWEIIVSEIIQLELKCAGDSQLSTEFCEVDNVLESLERIGKCIDSHIQKKTTLEETLTKLQNSSQILASKAGEAQKIAEIEQRKINKEKEEAIIEKQHLEQQLVNLKDKLENKVFEDKKLIKDLEATALNQKLIIKKITDDLNSLQNLYENCSATINDLRESNYKLTEENRRNKADLEASKQDLVKKSEQLRTLQTELHLLRNKPVVDCSSQMHREELQHDVDCQTDQQTFKKTHDASDHSYVKFNKRIKGKVHKFNTNEVQVLRADVDSSSDFVKNTHKIYRDFDYSSNEKNRSQISLNISLETGKDADSIYKSSTSNAIDLEIDMNCKQLEDVTNLLTNEHNMNDDRNDNKVAIVDSNDGDVFMIYDNTPLTGNKNRSKSIPREAANSGKLYTRGESSHEAMKSNSPDFNIIKNNRSSSLEVDKESLNSDNKDRYVSPVRTTQSVINIQSELKSSISFDAPSSLAVSNKSSSHEFYQNKFVFNVRTEDRPRSAFKMKQNKKDKQSQHKLSRVRANDKLLAMDTTTAYHNNFKIDESTAPKKISRSHSEERSRIRRNTVDQSKPDFLTVKRYLSPSKAQQTEKPFYDDRAIDSTYLVSQTCVDRGMMAKLDDVEKYITEINLLKKALDDMEKDYKNKIEVIKSQYDNHIKSIWNEHNQGVRSMQSLHEETLEDTIKTHENEVENLRTLSIEAMRKVEKLEKENMQLRLKQEVLSLDEGTMKLESKKKKLKNKKTKTLTKTSVEEFNVKPKLRTFGPCTCSLDVNVSDTIRKIFEQADADQRKMAEHTYLKYIVNKIIHDNINALDSQELAFLHLKVCRTWKNKVSKEQIIQQKIDTLESERLNKQRNAQRHIAELDRQVAEERRRLDEVREAVCRSMPRGRQVEVELGRHLELGRSMGLGPPMELGRPMGLEQTMEMGRTTKMDRIMEMGRPMDVRRSLEIGRPMDMDFERSMDVRRPIELVQSMEYEPDHMPIAEKHASCSCNTGQYNELGDRRSLGDLMYKHSLRPKQARQESNRAVLVKMDADERKERRRCCQDEQPVRLRRSPPADRPPQPPHHKYRK